MKPRVIAARLADRIESLCRELLPLGHKERSEWVEAKRANGGRGDGLKVHIGPRRPGVWAHFGENSLARGDALDLVAYILFDGSKSQAIRWAGDWLGRAQ